MNDLLYFDFVRHMNALITSEHTHVGDLLSDYDLLMEDYGVAPGHAEYARGDFRDSEKFNDFLTEIANIRDNEYSVGVLKFDIDARFGNFIGL